MTFNQSSVRRSGTAKCILIVCSMVAVIGIQPAFAENVTLYPILDTTVSYDINSGTTTVQPYGQGKPHCPDGRHPGGRGTPYPLLSVP